MNRNTRGILCTLMGGIFWGFSGACGQYILSNYEIEPIWLTVTRMLGAGVALTILSFLRHRDKVRGMWRTPADALQMILFALFGIAFSQFTYLTSIDYSNAGTATVLQYIGPVLIMAFVCVRNRRLPNVLETIAILLAVGGTYLLATHGNPNTMVLSKEALFWGLLSAISLALYTLLPARIIPKWGSIPVTGWAMLIGGAGLGVTMRVWTISVSLDFSGVLAVCGMVVMGTLLAYTLYLQGVADIGAVRASLLCSVEPVSATLFSVLWLGTEFMMIDLLGFSCILTTVFLLAGRKRT